MSTSKLAVRSRSSAAGLSVWTVPVAVTVSVVIALIVLYFGTFRSIVAIWWRSGTYAHGFLIVPISLWLVWEGRERLHGLVPRTDGRAIGVLGILGFGWLACRIAGVQGLEQYFAVAAVPVAVWAVLGWEVTKRLAFPLGFLLLAVPVGEGLIPPLIDFTAAFTVAGIELSGVPVLQQGNQLTLPNGNWSVVEACSGLRYLIASVTVGVLFAYLSFRSWRGRALCVLASIVVPIFANGFRAYMIVMLGYLSDMRLAVGIDHLIYGWVFFGLVMMAFFAVASRFRDDGPETVRDAPVTGDVPPSTPRRFLAIGLAAVLVASLWPLWVARVEARAPSLQASFAFPETIGPWERSRREIGFRPHYEGADLETEATYGNGADLVGVHIAYYRFQRQGAELVSSSNRLSGGDDGFRVADRHKRAGGGHPVTEARLEGPGRELLVWTWYWIDGRATTSPYRAKWLEMTGKLLGDAPPAAGLTVSTLIRGDESEARHRLERFADTALPEIHRRLVVLSDAGGAE